MEAIQKAVDERNIFGGTVTLGKAITYLKGATMNYMKNVEDMNRQLQESYQSGSVSPAVTQAIMGAVPMGAEIKGLYHGSPYKFTKFAQEKIGTGEGAQAFGYGHYLTESPEIASSYGESVSNMKATNLFRDIPISKLPYDQGSVVSNILMKQQKGQSFNEAKQSLMDYLQKSNQTDKFDFLNSLNEQDFKIIKNKYLYFTTVNKGKPSSADVFLEWDKPVSEEVRNKLLKFIPEAKDQYRKAGLIPDISRANKLASIEKNFPLNIKGSGLYEELSHVFGEKETSDLFARAGITGIKYPSGTLSGIKDSPYYNYVIFNPEDITIEAVK